MDSAALKTSSEPLGWVEWGRLLAACGVSVLLLWTLGWRVSEPADPQMAVTLTESGRAVLAALPTLVILTVISAAVGTAIVGKRLPEAGALAAAIGLAAMSLRGGSMQMLLAYYADSAPSPRKALMLAMLADSLLWTVIMTAAWITVVLVGRWLWGDQQSLLLPEPAPVRPVRPGKPPSKPEAAPKAKAGWPALAITTVVAVIVIWTTISRTPVACIARGQVLFAVGVGLYLGALAARYFTAVDDSTWYVLAAPAAALIGFILGHISSDMGWASGTAWQPYAQLATTPPHDLARALPIEYIAMGVAGALTGFWSGQRFEHGEHREAS